MPWMKGQKGFHQHTNVKSLLVSLVEVIETEAECKYILDKHVVFFPERIKSELRSDIILLNTQKCTEEWKQEEKNSSILKFLVWTWCFT